VWSIIQIIILLTFLEGILSIDNAAVLGAMVAHLPRDKGIPWPKWLHFMEGHGERLLGPQQAAALKVGLLGAYIGRGLMLALAFIITKNEWILVLGAAYLFWLGINHFAALYHKEQAAKGGIDRIKTTGFWPTVLIIELIDLAFSLDNVVVAVQLDPLRRFWVIALGVGIGILVMRFAASIFTRLIEWEPNLEHAAFALLLAIGAETMLKAFTGIETPHWLKFVISMFVLLLTIGMSKLPVLRPVKQFLRLGLPLASWIHAVVNVILFPVRWLFGLLIAPFRTRVAAKLHGED
jgi:tellurite resistance protein TerC